MGLFGRRKDASGRGEAELAKALALRGERVPAELLSLRETGASRGGGAARELEMTLRFTPAGEPAPREVTIRQFMNDVTRTGLEPGAPATVLYDRDDPAACMVEGSPRYRITRHGAVPADAPPVPDELA